jgi:TIR domain
MVTYQVQVVQVDRPDWLDALRQAVAAELRAIGVHRSIVVDVTETISPPVNEPTVAAVLIGPASATSPDLNAKVDAVFANGTVAVPVLDDLGTFSSQVPSRLSPFNAFEWSGVDPQRGLARALLEELGIEERNRRTFISHKRADGLGAAQQIHDALSHARFEPYIDRFVIRPGDDVQRRIADGLERHAFLLILETPEAHLSDWVYDEVDYALSHTMGNLIVQWPNVTTQIPGSAGVPRLRLEASDLVKDGHGYDVLTEEALDRLVEAVEAAHANGLARRRRMLVSNVEEAVRATDGKCTPLKNWMLDVLGPAGRAVVGVAPRLPVAHDLQRVDEVRDQTDPGAAAILVHATRHLSEDLAHHLDWVRGNRSFTLLPDNAVGAYWVT